MIAAFSGFLTLFFKMKMQFSSITFSLLFPLEHLLGVLPSRARSHAQAVFSSEVSLLSDSISSCSLL